MICGDPEKQSKARFQPETMIVLACFDHTPFREGRVSKPQGDGAVCTRCDRSLPDPRRESRTERYPQLRDSTGVSDGGVV